MTDKQLLALAMIYIDEKMGNISSRRGRDGRNGINGKDGIDGKDGLPGKDGKDGKDFSFEENEEKIRSILSDLTLKFKDLTEAEKEELRGPRGFEGKRGIDGKSFDMSEHELQIKSWIEERSLKFKDLSVDDIEKIRGPRGFPGKNGLNGKSFDMSEHEQSIRGWIAEASLKFKDLTEAEKEELRGPRGFPGKDGAKGRNFSMEEHGEAVMDIIAQVIESTAEDLKLKFSDLTEEEIRSLKLSFDDLTEKEKLSLKGERGPRGERGQKGSAGRDGKDGIAGRNGLPGLPGEIGPRGLSGKDGRDGRDAPFIVNIELVELRDTFYFDFYFSDGRVISTNEILRPLSKIIESYVIGGGLGGSGGGSSVIVSDSEGVKGPRKEIEFSEDFTLEVDPSGDSVKVSLSDEVLASIPLFKDGDLVGNAKNIDFRGNVNVSVDPDGNATVEVPFTPTYNNGVLLGEAKELNFSEGLEASIDEEGRVTVVAPDPHILKNYTCDPEVYVGAVVHLYKGYVPVPMNEWVPIASAQPLMHYKMRPQAGNAIANVIIKSRPVGIVINKPTSETCDILTMGTTEELYSDLDPNLEYFLSGTVAGGMVSEDELDLVSGNVKVRVGLPASGEKFIFNRGDRSILA